MATSETQTGLLLGPADAGRWVSAEEFSEAEFVRPWRFERAGGRLVIRAPSGEDHVGCSEPVRDRLGAYRLAHPEVVDRVVSEAWVRVDGGTDRISDIAVYLIGDDPPAKIPDRVPDLVFEIVSPGEENRDRDYVEKRSEYHRLGVREYIIIDRLTGRVMVLNHAAGGYEERVLRAEETYSTPLLPGLAIPLAEVLGGRGEARHGD